MTSTDYDAWETQYRSCNKNFSSNMKISDGTRLQPGSSKAVIYKCNKDGNLTENNIYDSILDPLVKAGRLISSPRYYGVWTDTWGNISQMVPMIKNATDTPTDTPCRILVIEYVNGPGTLEYMISKKELSLNSIKHILFQLLHSLRIYNNVFLKHHDLELRNIVLRSRKYETHYCKVIHETETYYVNLDLVPVIIDFDRGSTNQIYNPSLDVTFCRLWSMCNCMNTKNDTYKLLRCFWQASDGTDWKNDFEKFLYNVIDKTILTQQNDMFNVYNLKHPEFLTFYKNVNSSDGLLSDEQFKTLDDILKDPFFDSLKTEPKSGIIWDNFREYWADIQHSL